MTKETLRLGTSVKPTLVTLTDEARQLLGGLPGCSPEQSLEDHRTLLETIVIGRVANGERPTGLIIGADDILRSIDTPPALRSGPRRR